MAHLHKKMKKGRPYYYIREICRVDGKPKVVSQIYLGTPEKILKKCQKAAELKRPLKIKTEEFGSLFICYQLEELLDTIGIIDSIVKPHPREKGPTVGEFFFYAWLNRLVAPKSKRALGDWYRKTSIQYIRSVDVEQLNSTRYWKKWDRVSAKDIEKIGKAFFNKVWSTQEISPECLLFDTSNYYTYMANYTDSELCRRGKNKASKHHLRQVGLALLVDRKTQIPMHYQVYGGNKHDSKVFKQMADEMFGVICDFNKTQQKLTIVFDKGMNSDDNIGFIDDHNRIHFITTYSPYFAEEIAATDLKHFTPVNTRKNLKLEECKKANDRLLAYRTKLTLWGKERTIIVTHNPVAARKKQYILHKKLDTLHESLLEFRENYRKNKPHWRKQDEIKRRYEKLCKRLHISSLYYQLEFEEQSNDKEIAFPKNSDQIKKAELSFGRNIIVTDNHDWTNDEIVQLSLDRYFVEKQFRASNDTQHINLKPFYHWTDGKIRCHLLTCVIAMTIMRLLEVKVEESQIRTSLNSNSGPAIIEEMRTLNAILSWYPGSRKAERSFEQPDMIQAEILKIFGWEIKQGGVLQKIAL